MSGPKPITKPRPKPEFLRDIEHDGSIAEKAREIAKAENRTLSGPLGNKPEEPESTRSVIGLTVEMPNAPHFRMAAGLRHRWIR